MDFWGIGWLEILAILVIALIIFGPKRLPEIGSKLGKTVRALKKTTSELTAQVTREIKAEEDHLPDKKKREGSKTNDSAKL